MAKEAIQDMTRGNPGKLIFSFGMPLLFGNILQQLYNFVDTVVVGRGAGLGALAAVGATGSINFLVLGFVIGLTQGVSILCAQYFGAKEEENIRKSITMSAILCFSTAVLLTLLSMAGARPLLQWMNTPASVLDDAVLYIQIIFGAIAVSTAYNFFSGILRALGDSKHPLNAMVLAFLINTVLDILFVIPGKMGVAGAAWATVIAKVFSALYCWFCLKKISMLRLSKADWKWDRTMFAKSAGLSLPVAVMNSITAVGVMVIQMAINGFGEVYVAAYAAANKVIIILEQISSTFGFAAGTFAGQNLGAGKITRIEKGVRQANWIVLAMNISCALLCTLAGKPMMELMMGTEDLQAVEIAVQTVTVLSWFMIFLGGLWIYRSSLQSMGDTLWPMASGLLEFFSRLFFCWLLPSVFGFVGILLAECSAWICAMLMLLAVYCITMRRLKKNPGLLSQILQQENDAL